MNDVVKVVKWYQMNIYHVDMYNLFFSQFMIYFLLVVTVITNFFL